RRDVNGSEYWRTTSSLEAGVPGCAGPRRAGVIASMRPDAPKIVDAAVQIMKAQLVPRRRPQGSNFPAAVPSPARFPARSAPLRLIRYCDRQLTPIPYARFLSCARFHNLRDVF